MPLRPMAGRVDRSRRRRLGGRNFAVLLPVWGFVVPRLVRNAGLNPAGTHPPPVR